MEIKHLALIPDGNRRWAKEKGLNPLTGHKKSTDIDNIVKICKTAENEGIKYLSVWAFSTENWKRNKTEIKGLFKILSSLIDYFATNKEFKSYLIKQIGRKKRLPTKLRKKIHKLEQRKIKNPKMTILIGIDYGGRDEILRVINTILRYKIKRVDERLFSKLLDTKGIPDPDIVIRTGGEKRLSGFMPFQTIYSELFFINKFFPDFAEEDLKKIIQEYKKRKRRFGK